MYKLISVFMFNFPVKMTDGLFEQILEESIGKSDEMNMQFIGDLCKGQYWAT